MSFFGFKSSREVEKEKRMAAEQAKREVEEQNNKSLNNLSKGSQIEFAIPFFDVFDPRLMDFGVPVAVHGTIAYSIDDIDHFNSVNKTETFSDETFQQKLRSTVTKYVKGIVTNAPTDSQIPVIQLERKIMEISELVEQKVRPQVERLFGITVRQIDVTNIIIDKDSRGYRELKALTADMEAENRRAQHRANLSNFELQNSLNQNQLKMQSSLDLDAMKRKQELDLGGQEQLQRINLENQRETMRVQREEMQRAARLQTEQTFLGAHQANLNAGVLNNATENGINAFRQQPQMAAPQMPGIGAPQMPGMGAKAATPQVSYMVGVNGQQAGPFDWNQLLQLVSQGQLTQQTYVWKQGMAQWQFAGQVQELLPLFMNAAPPQIPGIPPMMPGM